jgi:predicted RNA-binding protein with PUA-like domain
MAKVSKPAFADPTAEEPGWVAVELEAGRALARRVSLAQIRAEPSLSNILLLRNSRLSVIPLAAAEFDRIVAMGG